MTRHLRRRADDGMGMVVVVATTAMVAMLLAVVASTVTASLRARGHHAAYDGAMDAAETGLDAVLGTLDRNRRLGIGPDVTPAVASAGRFPSRSAERSWVLATLQTQPTVRTSTGEYAAIRPASLHTAYAIGWWPSKARAMRTRLVKADFQTEPLVPTGALLAGGTIHLGGAFDVTRRSGVSASPDVHTNGDLTGNAASITMAGDVTASGTSGYAHATAGAPPVDIPVMDPRAFYDARVATYADHWYDLCPDGAAHLPALAAGAAPCSNPATVAVGGWTYAGAAWVESTPGPPGVFYVYGADVIVDLNRDSVAQTIVSESSQNRSCPAPPDGDIGIQHATVAAFVPGTAVLSGNDLVLESQAAVTGGMAGAQGGVVMRTASSDGVTGYVIAENLCTGSENWLQGSGIAYDPRPGAGGYMPLEVIAENELSLG